VMVSNEKENGNMLQGHTAIWVSKQESSWNYYVK